MADDLIRDNEKHLEELTASPLELGQWECLIRDAAQPRSRVRESVDALSWKVKLANYHRTELRQLLDRPVPFGEKGIAIDAHTVGLINAMHSLGDLIAQLINRVALNGTFADKQVAIKSTQFQAVVGEKDSHLLAAIQKLLDSSPFKLIDHLCNTGKHRRAVGTGHLMIGLGAAGTAPEKFGSLGVFLQTVQHSPNNMNFHDIEIFLRSDVRSFLNGISEIGVRLTTLLPASVDYQTSAGQNIRS